MRRWCVGWPTGVPCEHETGRYSKSGRRNPYWCPTCDEARISHLIASFEAIAESFKAQERPEVTP